MISEIKTRIISAIDTLRGGTGTQASAIILVEHPGLANEKIAQGSRNIVEKVNRATKAAYEEAIKKHTNITYVSKGDINLASDDFNTITCINENGMRKYSNCILCF